MKPDRDEICNILRDHGSMLLYELNDDIVRRQFRNSLYSALNIMYEDNAIQSFRIDVREMDPSRPSWFCSVVQVNDDIYFIECDGLQLSVDVVDK